MQQLLLKYVDSLIYYIRVCYTNFINLSKFQVNRVTHIKVTRQDVFNQARVMVICVESDLKYLEATFILVSHQINVSFDYRFCHSITIIGMEIVCRPCL